jgi:hypothetical protein
MSSTAKEMKRAKHRRGLLRLGGYFCVVTLVCGLVTVRHARAEFQDQTLVFGRQMADLAKPTSHDLTKVVFNGQNMFVGSSSTQDAPKTVLKRYEDYCNAHSAEAKAGKLSPPSGWEATQVDATGTTTPMLAGDDAQAAVMCFVKGPRSKASAKEAFDSFIATGELGAFGEFRYAYASKGRNGETFVLTAWTDSQFNMLKLLGGEHGENTDVPGEDFGEVPRVPNSVRIIAAHAEGTPYGVNVYRTTDSPSNVLSFYDKDMKARGWFGYDPKISETEPNSQGRAYMKDGVVVTVASTVQDKDHVVALGLSGVSADDRQKIR